MKSMTTKILALTAALCGLHLSAATPVAVWDGDFSSTSTKGNYKLDANGNTVASDGSTITIVSKGVKVWRTDSAEQSSGMTVLFKYSDMTFGKKQALATVCSSGSGSYFGVDLQTDNKTKGIYKDVEWSSESGATTTTFSTGSGTLALTYKNDGGTHCYYLANGSRTTIYSCGGLKESARSPWGVNVGGMHDTTVTGAVGAKISAIAVFEGVLSESDMKSYVWPSELSKMYSNRLSTGDAVVSAKTYGAITVPGWGYKATAFTAATKLTTTTSGDEVTGSYANIIVKKAWTSNENDTDLSVHTVAGWFKMDALPTSSGVDNAKTLFAVKSGEHSSYAGYKVAVDSDGKIYIGQCDNEAWRDNKVSTTDNLVKAGEWFHLAIACSGRTDGNRNSSATFFFNGNKVPSTNTKFKTNLNGSNCDYIRIGGVGVTSNLGISAAGIYVDTRAIDNAKAVISAATDFVVAVTPKYTATISDGTATWSALSWEPTKPATFESNAELTVNNTSANATITMDESVTVAKLAVTSDAGKNVTFASGSGTVAIGTYDFSGANGKVSVGFGTGTAAVTAGKDTVLPSSGTGALTVGDNKKVTVLDGSWSGTKTLTSTSELCYGGTMPSTMPYTEGNPTGDAIVGYAGTHMASGTIGFSNNLTTRRIEAGANIKASKLQLGNSDNAVQTFEQTGGVIEATSNGAGTETGNAAIIIAHYGWNAPSDVTYNLLGGSMVATNSTQYGVYFGADGKATMTIGNGSSEAVLDTTGIAQGNQDRTKASALTIAEKGTLKLGTGGLYFRNANATVTLSGGTIHAKDNCSLSVAKSDGIVLAAGKDSKFSAAKDKTLTVSSKVSGSGSLTKTGAGSVKLSGNNTFTGGTTISEGVLVLDSDSALGSGTVTLTANGQLDLYGHSATVTIVGSGTICNSSSTTAHINGIPVGAGKELTFTEGKTSIIVPEGETLTLTALPPNGTVTVGGAGRVAYTTSATAPAYPTWTWIADGDDAWTGTYALTGFTTATKDACGENGWDLRPYYNGTNSVFEIVGSSASATVEGYFNNVSISVGELVLNGAIKIVNGYSNYTYSFTKISGGKAFTINTGSTTITATVKFADISAFTGTLSVSSPKNSDKKCYCVIVGEGTLSEWDASDMSSIYFTGDTTLNMVTFSASNGVKVNGDAVVTVLASKFPQCSSGTMTFENGSSIVLEDANANTKLIATGGISVAEGVTIPVTIADATGLAADKVCITWPSQPAGNFSLVASGVAAGQTGFKASKNDTTLTAIADTSKTYYEVEGGETTTFDNQWLTDAKISGSTEQVQTALNGTNANGIKMSDVYLMGYEAKDAQNAAVILKPDQAQSNGETISLSVAGVPNETRNGAVITYTALASADRNWESPSVEKEIGASRSVSMELPASGVRYYRIQATVALP